MEVHWPIRSGVLGDDDLANAKMTCIQLENGGVVVASVAFQIVVVTLSIRHSMVANLLDPYRIMIETFDGLRAAIDHTFCWLGPHR